MILLSAHGIVRTADVCILGAGPVGLALAFTLEEKGKTVLLIDAGPLRGAAAPDFSTTLRTQHHADLKGATAAGLGGTTALWGGRCVAYDDIDFEVRRYVPNSGWPIPHDALKKYYKDALEFLNCEVGKEQDESQSFSDQQINFGSMEWWSSEPNLEVRYRKRVEASRLIDFLPETMVTSLETVSEDRVNINIAHKATPHQISANRVVLACGGIGNARLLYSLTEENAPFHISRSLGRFYQGHLTGYLAVAELRPEIVKELSFKTNECGGVFRRRIQISFDEQKRQELLNTVFWLDPISISDPIHGSATLSAIYVFSRMAGLYNLLGEKKAASSKPRASVAWKEHFKNLKPSLRSLHDCLKLFRNILFSTNKRRDLLKNVNGRYLLRYHAEQVPDPDSRIQMTKAATRADPPALQIDYRLNDADIDSVLRSHESLDCWLQEAGAGRLEYLHSSSGRRQSIVQQAFDGFHQVGSTRMSKDSDYGVVDENCKVHGTDNLYVVGSSVFPTGGHANPTLPAVALAIRLGHYLGTDAFKSDVRQHSGCARPTSHHF